jgi:hypothetical protein
MWLLILVLASALTLHGKIDWKKVDAEALEHFTELVRIVTCRRFNTHLSIM